MVLTMVVLTKAAILAGQKLLTPKYFTEVLDMAGFWKIFRWTTFEARMPEGKIFSRLAASWTRTSLWTRTRCMKRLAGSSVIFFTTLLRLEEDTALSIAWTSMSESKLKLSRFKSTVLSFDCCSQTGFVNKLYKKFLFLLQLQLLTFKNTSLTNFVYKMSKKGQQTYMSSSTYKLACFTFNFFYFNFKLTSFYVTFGKDYKTT